MHESTDALMLCMQTVSLLHVSFSSVSLLKTDLFKLSLALLALQTLRNC